MAIFSLTTAPEIVFQGPPNCIGIAIQNVGGDDVDVVINREPGTPSTVAQNTSLPFSRKITGGIQVVTCAAHTSSSTVDISIIYA